MKPIGIIALNFFKVLGVFSKSAGNLVLSLGLWVQRGFRYRASSWVDWEGTKNTRKVYHIYTIYRVSLLDVFVELSTLYQAFCANPQNERTILTVGHFA